MQQSRFELKTENSKLKTVQGLVVDLYTEILLLK